MAYGNSIAGLVTRWGLAWGIQWWWRCLWHGFLQSNCDFTILQQCSELRYPVPELWIISLQVICWGCRLYPVKEQVFSWPILQLHSLARWGNPYQSIHLYMRPPHTWKLVQSGHENILFSLTSRIQKCGAWDQQILKQVLHSRDPVMYIAVAKICPFAEDHRVSIEHCT
jgi:hypothetical protein